MVALPARLKRLGGRSRQRNKTGFLYRDRSWLTKLRDYDELSSDGDVRSRTFPDLEAGAARTRGTEVRVHDAEPNNEVDGLN